MFILEGIPAILCGVYTYFFVPNYPDEHAKFLTAEEKETVIEALPKTQPKGSAKTWNSAQVGALFRDPTFASFTFIWIFHAIGGWGISKVLPTVIYELDLTNSAIAQLMTMVSLFVQYTLAGRLDGLTFDLACLHFRMYLSCPHRLDDPQEESVKLDSCNST